MTGLRQARNTSLRGEHDREKDQGGERVHGDGYANSVASEIYTVQYGTVIIPSDAQSFFHQKQKHVR